MPDTQAEQEAPETTKGPPQKKMFCVYDDDEVKIGEIQAAFKLNRSDIMRRGLHMLHDYLVNDRLPDGQSRSVVEGAADEVVD